MCTVPGDNYELPKSAQNNNLWIRQNQHKQMLSYTSKLIVDDSYLDSYYHRDKRLYFPTYFEPAITIWNSTMTFYGGVMGTYPGPYNHIFFNSKYGTSDHNAYHWENVTFFNKM